MNERVIERWKTALATARHDDLDEIYTSDALFDVNVPEWRFQLRGPDAIARQLDEWHPTAPNLVEWRLRSAPWGCIVELALWEGDDHALYSRSVHLFELDGDLVGRHVMYCIGDLTRAAYERVTAGLVVA